MLSSSHYSEHFIRLGGGQDIVCSRVIFEAPGPEDISTHQLHVLEVSLARPYGDRFVDEYAIAEAEQLAQ